MTISIHIILPMKKNEKKYIRFVTNDMNIYNRIFEYNITCRIKDMLYDFLRRTNSQPIIDQEHISFLYKGKILNKQDILNKTVGEVFRNEGNNFRIRVLDSNNII